MSNTEPRTSPPPVPPGNDTAPSNQSPVATLLKAPRKVGDLIAANANPLGTGAAFLLCGVLTHAAFGLAMGLFGGWQVAGMDVVKAPLVALFALLLCFPSLYVFSCVGGAPLSISQVFMLGTSCLAMVGLLLVALAPVAWIFAVSTQSIWFMAALTFFLWMVAASFAISYVGKLRGNPLFARTIAVKFWFFILMLVTLQMTTCLRPMLVKPDAGWWTADKKFFLAHFASAFEHRKQPPKDVRDSDAATRPGPSENL